NAPGTLARIAVSRLDRVNFINKRDKDKLMSNTKNVMITIFNRSASIATSATAVRDDPIWNPIRNTPESPNHLGYQNLVPKYRINNRVPIKLPNSHARGK